MPEKIEITVRNKLVNEKRDLNVYHHSTRSAYMISHGNAITIPLGTVQDREYLHFSIVSGPGSMEKDYWINLPSWCDFTISGLGNGDLTHSGNRILLKIPRTSCMAVENNATIRAYEYTNGGLYNHS
ncbi:MAG: hypothetical protein PVH61_30270 [Candidatus Aminicenantes bacterium]|jgi:hypothetical protein